MAKKRIQSPANIFVAGGVADKVNLFWDGGPALNSIGVDNSGTIDRSLSGGGNGNSSSTWQYNPNGGYTDTAGTLMTGLQTQTGKNRWNGKTSGYGSGLNTDTLITGGTEAISSFMSNYVPNSKNEQDKNKFAGMAGDAAMSAGNQYKYNSNTTTGLLNQINNGGAQTSSITDTNIDWKTYRPSKAQQLANVGKATASGAAIGTSIMPGWGTVIGAGVGLLASTFGSWFGRNKAKKEARRREQEAQRVAALQAHSNAANIASNQYAINNAVANQQAYANNYMLANYHAFGGPIDPPKESEEASTTAVNNIRPDLDSTFIRNDRINSIIEKDKKTIDQMSMDEVRTKANQMIDAYSNPNRFRDDVSMESYLAPNQKAFGGMFDLSPATYDMFNTQMNVSRANTIDKVKMNDGLNLNKYDFGGQAQTLMSYNPDVTEINAGGTHEQNPNQGVQVGVDKRGIPNMVEEGEVIWKRPSNSLIGKNMFAEGGGTDAEYVFTNRWNPTQELLREVGIAKKKTDNKKDKVPTDSYADVAKDINKAAKERPNDPIARNTINKNLERLAQAQEKERAMREMQALAQEQEARRNMALGMGSMMGQGMNPSDNMVSERQHNQPNEDQSLSEYNRSGSPMLMAYGGPANIHATNPWLENYLKNNPYGNTSYNQQVMDRVAPVPQFKSPVTQDPPFGNDGLIKWTSPDGSTVIFDGGGASHSSSTSQRMKSGKFIPTDGTFFTYKEPEERMDGVVEQAPPDRPHEFNMTSGDMPTELPPFEPNLKNTTFLRYAPVWGSLFNVGMDIAGKNSPDYRYVNQIGAEANKGSFVPVASNPVGDYLAYNPFDRNYMTNKLNAQANATNRAIENASGGQRNNYLANLIAANYGSQIALGDAQRKADEMNLAQRQSTTSFNRDTNKFNSEEDLKAQMANQQALASLRQFKLAGLGEAAKLKYQMDMDDLSRRHANFTSLFNNLGEVGRDALNYNMVMSNPSLLYYMNKDGSIDYKGLLAQTQKEEQERRNKKGKKKEANA